MVPLNAPPVVQALGMGAIMLMYVLVYYSFFILIYPNYFHQNVLLLLLCSIVAYLLFVGMDYIFFHKLLPSMGLIVLPSRLAISWLFKNSLFQVCVISFIAFSSFKNRLAMELIKSQAEKEKTQTLKEKDLILIEKTLLLGQLNFLRDQFNSHMTFNFLNFCYSKVLPSSAEAANAIELYTNMLNYSLLIKPDENVPLAKEVTYISEFIGLQKCLHNRMFIEFRKEGDLEKKQLLPRILISFVENAIKHGQFTNKEHPIRICLQALPESIVFKVENKKDLAKKKMNTGIGTKNLIQVLELCYKDKYKLTTNENEEDYSSELILSI
jgi:sensor histidine kinase YesM